MIKPAYGLKHEWIVTCNICGGSKSAKGEDRSEAVKSLGWKLALRPEPYWHTIVVCDGCQDLFGQPCKIAPPLSEDQIRQRFCEKISAQKRERKLGRK